MHQINNIFENTKEFIWDIIGYLIPGFYLIIISSILIKYKVDLNQYVISQYNNYIVVLVISYILGHAVFGITKIIDEAFKDLSSLKKTNEKIEKRSNFIASKKIIDNLSKIKNLELDKNSTFRDYRSLAMGFCPESEQKIYTFMFRSDLSNNIGYINLIFGILGFVSIYCKNLNGIFVSDVSLIYILLILSYFAFRKTKYYFYSIAMSLPFTVFLTKYLNDK